MTASGTSRTRMDQGSKANPRELAFLDSPPPSRQGTRFSSKRGNPPESVGIEEVERTEARLGMHAVKQTTDLATRVRVPGWAPALGTPPVAPQF